MLCKTILVPFEKNMFYWFLQVSSWFPSVLKQLLKKLCGQCCLLPCPLHSVPSLALMTRLHHYWHHNSMSGYDKEFKCSKESKSWSLNPSILQTKVNRFLESFHHAHKQTKQTFALWGYGFLESFHHAHKQTKQTCALWGYGFLESLCFVLKQTKETSAMWTYDS
jgi:hypothetical protein